jgi:hypothetical protein
MPPVASTGEVTVVAAVFAAPRGLLGSALSARCRRRTQYSQDPSRNISAHEVHVGKHGDRVRRVSQLSEFVAFARRAAVVSDERTAEIWSRDEAVAVIRRAQLRLPAGMKAERLRLHDPSVVRKKRRWPDRVLVLLPHQFDWLRPLLDKGTDHLSLGVELELVDPRIRVGEAHLCARGER